MKQTIMVLGILIAALSLSGCTDKMNTYAHEDRPTEYLELYADNQYAIVSDAGFCGTWRIHDDILHLYFNDALLYVLKYDDGSYIDPDGDRWVRK